MVKKWGVFILAMLATAAVLIAGAGAGTKPAPIPGIELSNNAAIAKYLATHGISSKGVVIQRGTHNYAGPSCPGINWNCTTAKLVVQISMGPNDANAFKCTASTTGSATSPNTCLIVQSSTGTDNNAECTEKIGDPTGSQSCQIYQLNTTGANRARIDQEVEHGSTSLTPQDAMQTTSVAQWNGDGSNSADVHQEIDQEQNASLGKTDTLTQMQDGHQTIAISQHSDTGNNDAHVDQALRQKLNASGGVSITQLQNTTPGSYNTSVLIHQNQDQEFGTIYSTGKNMADVHQLNDLNAKGSKTGTLTQTQGAPNNGEFVDIDQYSLGSSNQRTNQDEHQTLGAPKMPAASLFQTQYGPQWFEPDQGSNPGDSMNIAQSSDQNAGPGADQTDEQGASCDTTGLCTVRQKNSNAGGNGSNSCSSSSCDIGLFVGSGGEGGGVHPCSGEGCTSPPYSPPSDPLNNEGICYFLPGLPVCID
jgi:hypothetical protein